MGFKLRYCPLVRRAKQEIPSPSISMGQMGGQHLGRGLMGASARYGRRQRPLARMSHGGSALSRTRFRAGGSLRGRGGNLCHPGTPDVIDAVAATITFENSSTSSWIQGDPQRNEFVSKFFLQVFQPGAAVSLHNRFHDGVLTRGRDYSESWSVEKDLPGEDAEGYKARTRRVHSVRQSGQATRNRGGDCVTASRATALILAAFESVKTGELQKVVY